MHDTITDDEIFLSHSIPDFASLNKVLLGENGPASRPAASPAWLERSKNVLNQILTLAENWDSYGAAKPNPDIVGSAHGFLLFVSQETTTSEPHVSPNRNGGIHFEWSNGPHELEVDIMTPSAATYVYENTESKTSCTGELYIDDADDGIFLAIVREHFGIAA